jgi:hypothetical protein
MFAKVVVALVAGGFGKHLAHRVGMMIADNGLKLTGNQSVKVGDMPEATWNPMCFCFCWRQVFCMDCICWEMPDNLSLKIVQN